jgi:hypothetical protein
MKKSILIFTLGLLLCTLSMAGPIKVTLYGKGGIIYTEGQSKVCPEQSECVCSQLTIDLSKLTQFEDGTIDALPATITFGKTTANILVNKMEHFEYDHRTVVMYESPDLNAYKEWGLGKASGVSFTWVDPVQLVPYEEEETNSEELDYIQITIKGQGGIVREAGENVVCPQKNDKVCARVEGSFWDLLCYWWSSKPVSETDQNGVTITTYEDGIASHSFKAKVSNVDLNSPIEKDDFGYNSGASTYKFKFIE